MTGSARAPACGRSGSSKYSSGSTASRAAAAGLTASRGEGSRLHSGSIAGPGSARAVARIGSGCGSYAGS